jgi:hypothetical protein
MLLNIFSMLNFNVKVDDGHYNTLMESTLTITSFFDANDSKGDVALHTHGWGFTYS